MGRFTPNLGLYAPGGGSTGTNIPDEVADVDKLNTNFDLIDTFAGTFPPAASRNNHSTGLAANIPTSGMKKGDTYTATDTEDVWKYDGANWVFNVGGMVLIKPTSVVGTGVTISNGKVVFGATTNSVQVNGVFSTRFRRYKILADWNVSGGANGALFELAAGGVVDTGANYYYQSLAATGAAVGASATGAGTNAMPGVSYVGNGHAIEYTLFRVGHPIDTFLSLFEFSPTAGEAFVSAYHQPSTAQDGFRLRLSDTSGGKLFSSGELAVYGLV